MTYDKWKTRSDRDDRERNDPDETYVCPYCKRRCYTGTPHMCGADSLAHPDDDDRDTALCQVCGSVTPEPTWRPDVTGHAGAGNVCPTCLAYYESARRATLDEIASQIGALEAAIREQSK